MASIDWGLTWDMVLAISTSVMALFIVITAIYAIRQLRHIKSARCSSLLMQLHQTWDSKEYIQSRIMINQYNKGSTPEEASRNLTESIKSFNETDAEEFFMMARIANFFENLGYLTCEGHLERKHALGLYGSPARRYWRLFYGFANYQREKTDEAQPDAWVYFQYLGTGCPQKNKCLEKLKTPILRICRYISKNANQ